MEQNLQNETDILINIKSRKKIACMHMKIEFSIPHTKFLLNLCLWVALFA